MSGYVYYKGLTTGEAIAVNWYDGDGVLRDFSTGWTFHGYITTRANPRATLLVDKTTGITGAATAPNVTIDFATADFTDLPADDWYNLLLVATPTSGDPVSFPEDIPFLLRTAPAAAP